MFKLRGGRFTLSTSAVKVAETPVEEKKEEIPEVEEVKVIEEKPEPQIVQEVEIPSLIEEKVEEPVQPVKKTKTAKPTLQASSSE